jgi:hypothetical protein
LSIILVFLIWSRPYFSGELSETGRCELPFLKPALVQIGAEALLVTFEDCRMCQMSEALFFLQRKCQALTTTTT